MGGKTALPPVAGWFPAVASGVNPFAGFRKRSQKIFRRHASSAQACADLLAQTLKAFLLWQKDEAIPQTQNSKRRAISQPKILAELFGNGKLSFLTDLGSRQIFESGIVGSHRR